VAEKRYIRLTAEHMEWTGHVAEFIKEQTMGPNSTQMYVFKDVSNDMGNDRIVTADEAEFITEKEYFVAVLQGKLFGG